MKKLALGLILLALVGCSGGGSNSGGGNSNSGVPYIQLTFDNTNVKRGQVVWATIAWNDLDGDITTLYVEEYYGPYRWNYSYSAGQLGIRGIAGSTRIYTISKSNASPGIHLTKFYFRDARGQRSNIIEININVYAMEQNKEQTVPMSVLGNLEK